MPGGWPAPIWRSEERWRARLLLGVVVALNLSLVGMSVLLSYWNREFFNSLQEKDADAFWALLFWWRQTDCGPMPGFVFVAALYILIAVYQLYLRQALQIRWRELADPAGAGPLAGRPRLLPHRADRSRHRQPGPAHRRGPAACSSTTPCRSASG